MSPPNYISPSRPIGRTAAAFLSFQPKKKIVSQDGRDTKTSTDEYVKWVFPASRGNGHYIALPDVLERLCKRASITDVTIHTLRHTYASVAAELGYSELTIAGLIGHKSSGITARYAHLPDRALLSAADTVSAHISNLLDGKEEEDKVVLFQRERVVRT